ncbi:MAG: SDR family oxidoreductase [Magnetococcales bacterium]|nr:SDR family oxidoreductase [Magnetococcales bacterium]
MKPTLVITGASRGLGSHIAKRAMEEGYRVIGMARNWDEGEGAFEQLVADVSDPEAVERVLKPFKRDASLYGLINAAGIASMNLTLLMPPETMRRIIEVNLLGTIHTCRIMGRYFARRGEGRIINFSTIAVPLALAGESVYAASKAGVENFTRTFAREMADHNVTVNAIAPGPVDTQLIAKVDPESINAIVARQIIARKATPEDVFGFVKLLLAPEAGMLTGEILHVGGV